MNLKRLSLILLFSAVGAMLFALWAEKQKVQKPSTQNQPKTLPTQQSPKAPATQPARSSAPSEEPPAVEPAASASAKNQATAAQAQQSSGAMTSYTNSIAEQKFVRIGSLDPGSGYTFEVELTNRAASIYTAKLSNYFATVADKRRHEQDPDTYQAACLEEPEKYKGNYSILNPVGAEGGLRYLPMETGRISIDIEGEDKPLDVDLKKLYWRPQKVAATTSPDSTQSASFTVKVFRGVNPAEARKNPLVRLVKTFTVTKDDYSIVMSVGVENLSGRHIKVSLDQAGPTGLPREGIRADFRQAAYAYQPENKPVQARLKPVAREIDKLSLDEKYELKMDKTTFVLWVGQINQFFGSMMYVRPAVEGRLAALAYRGKFYVSPALEAPDRRVYRTGVEVPDLELRPGQTRQITFDVFAGPKKRNLFVNENAKYFKPLYKDLKYLGTIDLGACFCTFDWLVLAMMWLLQTFSRVALGNYGVAIIMVVILVRFILHPLTKKSQVSMMRMQKLAPQMQKLKEKYADDKDTLQKETMKFYKQQGTAPLMGCLPMFLQMPILVALYTGLNAAVELRHAAFLPVWITDLAAPDALFSWETPLPLIGTDFNLLPLLLGLAMLLQQKFMPQSSQAAASPEQATQQKMMKIMFPLMMPVLFYKLPSGLNLYFMVSTFAGVLDQYVVRKHIKEKEAREAAEQTTVRVPGKPLRSSRPKKPKGPFWMKHG